MIKSLRTLLCIGFLLLGLLSTANAALESRLGSLAVYDTDLNITWLANANAGAGSSFDTIHWGEPFETTDGLMYTVDALAWAASFNMGGVSGWRLSTTDEMSHLFYNELGGVVGSSILSSSDPDLALFTNIQPSGYVSSTYFPPTPDFPQALWGVFNFGNGFQDQAPDILWISYAWAVHDGDVAAIPEPEMYAMMVLGLAVLLGFGRLRQH